MNLCEKEAGEDDIDEMQFRSVSRIPETERTVCHYILQVTRKPACILLHSIHPRHVDFPPYFRFFTILSPPTHQRKTIYLSSSNSIYTITTPIKMQDSDTETPTGIDPTFIHLSTTLPALPPPPPRIPPTPEIQDVRPLCTQTSKHPLIAAGN